MNTNAGMVILIPASANYDVHICGTCKTQFFLLENFIQHKQQGCSTLTLGVLNGRFDDAPSDCTISPQESLVSSADKSVIVRNEPVIRKKKVEEVEEKKFKNSESLVEDSCKSIQSSSDFQTRNYNETNGRFSCDFTECHYTTSAKKDMERHIRTHTGERPFKCRARNCGKRFTRNDKRRAHERIHYGDKKYKCSECEYATVDLSSLKKHQLIHLGLKPYKCQLCPYRARSQSGLIVHLRMHTGDTPYLCTHDQCKSAFKTATDLKRHAVTHSQFKPHACQYCPFRTAFKHGLSAHLSKKHPNGEDGVNKQYACPHCPTTFSTTRKQQNHIKIHKPLSSLEETPKRTCIKRKRRRGAKMELPHGVMVREYQCGECNAAFVSPGSLNVHQMQHQKNSKVTSCLEDEAAVEPEVLFGVAGKKQVMGLSPPYLECSQLDSNLHTAEMLASLAGEVHSSRPFEQVSPDFFPSHDLSSPHEGIKFEY